jgi:hypothetical protein
MLKLFKKEGKEKGNVEKPISLVEYQFDTVEELITD